MKKFEQKTRLTFSSCCGQKFDANKVNFPIERKNEVLSGHLQTNIEDGKKRMPKQSSLSQD